jgi:hypothetical protein
MLIKLWSADQSKENVSLYLQNETFCAEVHKNGKVYEIGKKWIVGLPKEISVISFGIQVERLPISKGMLLGSFSGDQLGNLHIINQKINKNLRIASI